MLERNEDGWYGTCDSCADFIQCPCGCKYGWCLQAGDFVEDDGEMCESINPLDSAIREFEAEDDEDPDVFDRYFDR